MHACILIKCARDLIFFGPQREHEQYQFQATSGCRQQGHACSKTAPTKSSPVVKRRCRLTQVDLYSGHKNSGCYCGCCFSFLSLSILSVHPVLPVQSVYNAMQCSLVSNYFDDLCFRRLPSAVHTTTPAFDVRSSGLFCSRPGGLELVTRLPARSVTFL